VQDADIKNVFDQLLEQFKRSQQELRLNRAEQLSRTLAVNAARSASGFLSSERMLVIIDQLFACETPAFTPSGKSIISLIPLEEIDVRFGN
jgi:DNA mismatch repair protein MutL